MNPTETATYRWLQREHGYGPDEIAFQYARNPDFLTIDGRGWEAKLLTGRVARFTARQVAEFRARESTVVILWRRGEPEPVATVDFNELPMPGWWREFTTYVVWQPGNGNPLALHSAAEVDVIVGRYVAQDMKRVGMLVSTVDRWYGSSYQPRPSLDQLRAGAAA